MHSRQRTGKMGGEWLEAAGDFSDLFFVPSQLRFNSDENVSSLKVLGRFGHGPSGAGPVTMVTSSSSLTVVMSFAVRRCFSFVEMSFV